jgi:hypothetical protein
MYLHLLKTYIRHPSLLFIAFSPSHMSRNDDAKILYLVVPYE